VRSQRRGERSRRIGEQLQAVLGVELVEPHGQDLAQVVAVVHPVVEPFDLLRDVGVEDLRRVVVKVVQPAPGDHQVRGVAHVPRRPDGAVDQRRQFHAADVVRSRDRGERPQAEPVVRAAVQRLGEAGRGRAAWEKPVTSTSRSSS
jgi:hypothetical protein